MDAALEDADVLLVNGGDTIYLDRWMRESGLAAVLPSLDLVYVGLSAGGMVLTPRIGEELVGWQPPDGGDDSTLGVVDFSIFPHLDDSDGSLNTTAAAEEWAAGVGGPAYAIDDDTAIKVTEEGVEVVSAGRWRAFPS